jgi:hypothetical protein
VRVFLALMVLFTVGVGFCIFDADEHGSADDGASLDLCSGLAITSVAMIVLRFVPIHELSVDPPYVVHAVPLYRLDPPPKSPSLP